MAILSVLVLCNCKIQDSKTANSLLRAYSSKPEAFESFKLVIYDNSPQSQAVPAEMPFQWEYKHDPDNGGLAAAYNYALQRAVDENYEWLLLLDQDTQLPEDFIYELTRVSEDIGEDSDVVAIVPRVFCNKKFFAPSRVLFGGMHRPINQHHRGICNFQVATIGSGVLLRTSFFQKIGGFSTVYWLDCLDRWIFNAIYSAGKKVYVTDSIIEQEMSILDYDKFMTEERYRNIIKYETIFMKSFKTRVENYFYLIRLLKRTFTLLLTVKNKKYALMTFGHLIRLIFCSLPSEETVEGKRPTLK